MPASRRMSLANSLYLTALLPMTIVSVVVGVTAWRGLASNAASLESALQLEGKTNVLPRLSLTQEDASKAILIDPSKLETFSTKKIEAYDEHKKLLAELSASAPTAEMKRLVQELDAIDDAKLQPTDTKVLEMLFENVDAARALYFREYEPHRVEYESRIRQLAILGSENAAKEAESVSRKNLISLLEILAASGLGLGVIALTITLLARRVAKSEANTQALLAVLSEGLFFFDASGRIAEERSQAMARVLPGSESIETLKDFAAHFAPETAGNVETCLALLWPKAGDDNGFVSDFDTTVSMLPREIKRDGKILLLEYRPLADKVVVVVRDVTQTLRFEREAQQQAERVRKISLVVAGTDSYLAFVDEARALFARADATISATNADLRQFRRDLHTLKGSVGTFEFSGLARAIHELESLVDAEGIKSPRTVAAWQAVLAQWTAEEADIAAVLGLGTSRTRVSVPRAKLEILQARATADMKELLRDLTRISPAEAFSKYERYLQQLAARDGEKGVRLAYSADSSDLEVPEVQRLDAAFVHIFRNGLDHGIESKELRAQARKDPTGTIHITCSRPAGGGLRVTIADDGCGVNADKLAHKAVKSGLWTEARAASASLAEKVDLLFAAGLSTNDTVTETSGRGVGMDAVRALVTALGGEVSVETKLGAGTTFIIEVP